MVKCEHVMVSKVDKRHPARKSDGPVRRHTTLKVADHAGVDSAHGGLVARRRRGGVLAEVSPALTTGGGVV